MWSRGPAQMQEESDPYYGSVTALLWGAGTDGSSTFTDQKGGTWANGGSYGAPYDNSRISNEQAKWGTTSIKQDAADIISNASPGVGLVLSGDYTVEAWVYLTGSTKSTILYLLDTVSYDVQLKLSGTAASFISNGNTERSHALGVSAVNRWVHCFCGRSGSNTYTGADGGGTSWAGISGAPSAMSVAIIGATAGSIRYINDIRVTKGVFRYGTTYTVPTSRFPNQ